MRNHVIQVDECESSSKGALHLGKGNSMLSPLHGPPKVHGMTLPPCPPRNRPAAADYARLRGQFAPHSSPKSDGRAGATGIPA